jgi:hypothetical protein
LLYKCCTGRFKKKTRAWFSTEEGSRFRTDKSRDHRAQVIGRDEKQEAKRARCIMCAKQVGKRWTGARITKQCTTCQVALCDVKKYGFTETCHDAFHAAVYSADEKVIEVLWESRSQIAEDRCQRKPVSQSARKHREPATKKSSRKSKSAVKSRPRKRNRATAELPTSSQSARKHRVATTKSSRRKSESTAKPSRPHSRKDLPESSQDGRGWEAFQALLEAADKN